MGSEYGANASITGSLNVDGNIDLGSGDDDIDLDNNTLFVFNDNSPSLDIYCKTCGQAFEVKSKCLSIKNLPKDVMMPHGSYDKFLKRVNDGISFVFVIYEVNRKQKQFSIRKVLFASHDDIISNEHVLVNNNNISSTKNNSLIIVPDINKLKSWNLFHPIRE